MQIDEHTDMPPMPSSPWNSLRFSLLIWFLLLSLSPVMITSVLDYYQTKNSLKVIAQKKLNQSSKQSKQFIDNWFDYRYMEINTQAKMSATAKLLSTYKINWKNSKLPLPEYIKSEEWQSLAENNQGDLLTFKQNLDYVYDVFLLDMTGNILFTFTNQSDLGENIITGKYADTKFSIAVQKTLKNKKTTFSGIERYKPSNDLITGFISSPIYNKNNQIIGVFSVQLSLDRIFDAFKTTENEEQPIKHYLVGNDRLLRSPIKNNRNDVLQKKIDTVNVNQWSESLLKSTLNTPFAIRGYQGPNSRVIGTSQIIDIGDVSWLLVSEMSESDALNASKIMLNTMFITIPIMIFVVLMASYFIARKFTLPITALTLASANFSKVKSHKIESNNSSTEINQLKLIIENASVGIWDWGIKDNTISVNDRWAEIMGYTIQELESLTIDTWLAKCHPDDLEKSHKKLKQYWAGEIEEYSMEARMMHKSGEWVWVYSSGKVVSWTEDKKPIRMIGIHLEITDRKNTESALATSEAQSRGIFNSVADGIISLNAKGDIISLNPAGEKIFNYTSHDVINKNISILMSESYKNSNPTGIAHFKKLKEGKFTNKTIEVEGLRSNGSIFPLELAISEVQVNNECNFTAIMRDISERKTIEVQQKQLHNLVKIKFNIAETLAEQLSMENRSIKAFESIMTLSFLYDIKFSGALILETNHEDIEKNTESLKWYSKHSLQHNDKEELKELALTCLSLNRKSINKIHFEASINKNNHHYLIPIYCLGSQDKGLGTLVFSTLTPHKKIEENLPILNEISDLFASAIVQNNARHFLKKASLIAEQNSHLKSEFLASMSHEIRTPMNGVLGMLGLLLNSDLNKDQENKVNLAKSSAESLLTLINDILDFSKVEAGKLGLEIIDFDLRKMIGNFSDSMALHAQEQNIELILDLKNIEQSMVKGDSGRIRQILTNLVSNAIKFTPEGEIVIRMSTALDTKNNLHLSCSVIDTGIGIPENKISLLFDKFTQVDTSTTREYGGTGLGLAISKKLCLLMNGDINVTSKLGEGSTFTFTVQLEKSDKSTQVLPTFNINELNILVVDDNATNRQVVNGQLTHWGANVIEADSGKNAINCCEQYALQHSNEMFDIALLDMQMPEMDGAELGQILHERFGSMKLVMMTSISIKNENQFFADLGFSAFFTKPATTSDLFDTLAILSDNGETLKHAHPLVTSDYIQSLKRHDLITKEKHKYTWPKSTRLLIVEDNRINQHVALGILKEFNLTADIAANGLEAIIAIKTAPINDPYTLVLMDCQMPEMDGYDATIAIRDEKAGIKHKKITIIAMTANAMEGDKEKCINVGMDDYISKPIESEYLLEKLQYWLIEKQGLATSDYINIKQNQVVTPIPEIKRSIEEQDIDSEKVSWDTKTALSRVRGNTKLLAKLVTMYLEDMPEHIEELKQAINNNNVELSKRTAHSIRGASGNLYAYRMQDLAKAIETHIIENIDNINFMELSNIAVLFDQEYAMLQLLLEDFVKEN